MNLLARIKNYFSEEVEETNLDWKVIAMDLNRDNDELRTQMKVLIQENVDLRKVIKVYKEKENV